MAEESGAVVIKRFRDNHFPFPLFQYWHERESVTEFVETTNVYDIGRHIQRPHSLAAKYKPLRCLSK